MVVLSGVMSDAARGSGVAVVGSGARTGAPRNAGELAGVEGASGGLGAVWSGVAAVRGGRVRRRNQRRQAG